MESTTVEETQVEVGGAPEPDRIEQAAEALQSDVARLEEAAAQGKARAQFNLGIMYELGPPDSS